MLNEVIICKESLSCESNVRFAFGGVASPPVFLRSDKKLLLDKALFVTIVELSVWTGEVILDGIE